MHSITIENFRCFGEKQTARLAPLTLLVGENSTGKTSFLALLRALDDFFHDDIPDFKRPPYDLGSFDEIAHYRGGRAGKAETFSAEIAGLPGSAPPEQWKLAVRFARHPKGTAPMLVYECVSMCGKGKNKAWMAIDVESLFIKMGTKNGTWNVSNKSHHLTIIRLHSRMKYNIISSLHSFMRDFIPSQNSSQLIDIGKSETENPDITEEDMMDLESLLHGTFERNNSPRIFASAPIRSQPRRTYDPASSVSDPEGHSVPMLLAELSLHQPEVWAKLKQHLENFGCSSGLFDEIRIRHLGRFPSDPFQVQVRKSGQTKRKGPWRNLIDVGYGVSQALPIITELLHDKVEQPWDDAEQERPESLYCYYPRQFLLQQPEVHLHPSAQAALGSVFCQVASPLRQLIVETHSDHLMDRVRMDVRDGVSGLKPEDVSILFFERRDLDVRIHSLRLDKQGNVLGAPDGYRQFFMDEMTRSLWPERSSEGSTVET